MQRRAAAVLAIAALVTAGAIYYSSANFRITVDVNQMIAEDLPFRKLERDLERALPKHTDTIVVVIEAPLPERAVQARERLASHLREKQQLFKDVYEPGGGPFFERNGLLYLDTGALQETADHLAAAQPLLALLLEDPSLHGFFSVLETAVSRSEEVELPEETLGSLFDRMSAAFEGVMSSRPYSLSWQELMLGERAAVEQRRQFIILQPRLDLASLTAGAEPLEAIRRAAHELRLDGSRGVTVRITGDVALSYENLMTVERSVGGASFLSLVLAGTILAIGLKGSGRLILASLATLISGLICTMGFAIAAVGSLNLISITFAVLFIGLGIDYSYQFCLRYRELIQAGVENRQAIATTARGVGMSLLLASLTTAIGFYSFIPTSYAGASELGLISGTGMFISFLANFTILPAILTLLPVRRGKHAEREGAPLPLEEKVMMLPYRHTGAVIIGALVIGAGAAALLPRLSFDYNPLNLYNPASESVTTAKALFKDPATAPWTASVLVEGAEETRELARRLERLDEVGSAVTVFDFVPDNQSEKLGVIADMALFMPPVPEGIAIRHRGYAETLEALASFEEALRHLSSSSPQLAPSARRLLERIDRFKAFAKNTPQGEQAFTALSDRLLSTLPMLLSRLDRSLQAAEVSLNDLPRELVDRSVTADGRYRIQVFPREDLTDIRALQRFVAAVQTVAPGATGSPVTILESGRVVVASFRQASLYALLAITAFLLIQMRSVTATLLILSPLVLALLMTAAASVIFSVPLNFANVIVVPLLLGIGVTNGIHFVHRYRTEPPADGNMLRTSTSRAVLFSTLDTVASFGILAFLPHRGIASLGILLTLCNAFLVLSSLLLLPALLKLFGKGRNA